MNCHDCPRLAGGRMPAGWTPRVKCCLAQERAILNEVVIPPEGASRAERRRSLRLHKRGPRA